jgi:tRNA threonylcarbamoyladenosine modification (KEOPS) complex  Pcc1 subunit
VDSENSREHGKVIQTKGHVKMEKINGTVQVHINATDLGATNF